MGKTWKVAVIGLGHWYSAYGLARGLAEYPHASLAAAAAEDPAQLAAFTSTFGVPGYADYREMLAREPVDIVHIAAPVSQIAEIAVASARAGKHLVLGKPMAMTVAEADRIVEAVEAAGVQCMPFQGIMRLRFAETVRRIRQGDIGDLLVLHQTSRWSIAEDAYQSGRPGWFADSRFVPGGAFIDEGIYWIDFFRYLTGSEIVTVEARMANLVHKDIDVEDWGLATFTFANGVVATLEASWTINAPRKSGPSPKQNSVVRFEGVGIARRDCRADVPLARTRRSRRRRRRLGVRAAGRAAGLRAAHAVPARASCRLPAVEHADHCFCEGGARGVRGGDGGLRVSKAGQDGQGQLSHEGRQTSAESTEKRSTGSKNEATKSTKADFGDRLRGDAGAGSEARLGWPLGQSRRYVFFVLSVGSVAPFLKSGISVTSPSAPPKGSGAQETISASRSAAAPA